MLAAHDKELAIRPPIEEFAASYFGYKRPRFTDEPEEPEVDTMVESDLPEYLP